MLIGSPHGRATMTITLLRSQLMFALALTVLLCPLAQVTAQGDSETHSPAQVLQDLLARHGDNNTITVPQLRALLALLSEGQGEGDGESSKGSEMTTATPQKTNSSKVRTNAFSYLILALWVDKVLHCGLYNRWQLDLCTCSNHILLWPFDKVLFVLHMLL